MKSKSSILPLLPSLYWVGSILATMVARNWWRKGQMGSDWYQAGSVLMAYFTIRTLFFGFKAGDQRRDLKKIQKALMQNSTAFGAARWADNKDTAQAGMEKPGGLILGELNGRLLYYHGPGSLITCAPPRSGKGVSLVLPNLLSYKHSCVVLDIKSELFLTTARHRREKLGNKIICLSPWAAKLSGEFGIPIRDHSFNPLSFLKRGAEIKDDAEMISSLLIPSKPNVSDTEDFWLQSGRDVLTSTMLFCVSRDGFVTLPGLRRLLFMTAAETATLLTEMIKNQDFGGVISEYGRKFSSAFSSAPKQWQGQITTAQKALSIYDSFSPLGKHTSIGEIDWAALKETPTTIYLMIPSERLESHFSWLNLVLSVGMEMISRSRSDKKVLFMMDEFGAGTMPAVLRALTLYPGQGVQIWAFLQEFSQLERYGKPGLQQFLGAASVINTFNTNDYQTAKLFSDWIGDRTVRDIGVNSGTDPLDQNAKTSLTYSDKGCALIRPEDVRLMDPDEQIILCRNVPPIRAKKIKYYEHPKMRNLADPNPYLTNEKL